MAVPPPLRDPDENTARGLQRVSAGVQQGRRAGLGQVRGKARGPAPAAPPEAAGVAWDYDNANSYRVNYDSGSMGANSADSPTVLSVTNLSDTDFFTDSPPTITLSGLYLLETSIAWSGGVDGEVVTVTIAGRTLQPVFFEASAGFVDRWAVPVNTSQGVAVSMANPSNTATVSWTSFSVSVYRILAV